MILLEKLQEKGIISPEIKEEIASRTSDESQAMNLLLYRRLVNSSELAGVRAEMFGLEIKEIPKDFTIPEELLSIFSQDAILNLKIIPLAQHEDEIEVGLVEPENSKVDAALDFIAVSHKATIRRFIITSDDFEKIREKMLKLETEVQQALERFEEEEQVRKGTGEEVISQVQLQRLTEEAPASQIVDVMLRYGVDSGASDIHVEPTGKEMRIRFRLDGKLKTSLILPKEVQSAIVSRIKILAHLRVDETRIPQDGRIHFLFGQKAVDFRVATFPTISGEKVALRILDPTKGITTLEELGLQLKSLDDVKEFMKKPFGAMLISGPTGSGKSTTLYAVLQELNREEANIVTLEDPVEYYIGGINQSQIRPEIDYTFASGLRQILRQDPNIIMVGEVRDKETSTLLVHAALTGHLVFSTIHTNNAIGIIPRLLDMGIDNFLIPSALRVAIAQRLVQKICQTCKAPYDPPSHVREIIEKEIGLLSEDTLERVGISTKDIPHIKLFKAPGCDECGGTGAKGRIAVFESMSVSQEMEKVIVEEPSEAKLREEASRQGMITMRQDGILKALKGIISVEGVLANTAPSYL